MKTAEEVLYDCTGMLAENHPSIIEAIKLYAIEACKETLRNAAENADVDFGESRSDVITVDKDSILSAANIPQELRNTISNNG